MRNKWSNPYKLISIIVILTVLVQVLLFSLEGIRSKGSANSKAANTSDADQGTAAEISNMTGVKSEQILKMKASGKSWNEILDALKTTDKGRNDTAKQKRSLDLLETGLGEDAIAHLVSQGFVEKDIMSAKLIAERAAEQIKELVQESPAQAPKAPISTTIQSELPNNDQESFMAEMSSVSDQFDLETSVRLMLSLKAEFGSYEAVLDEYLHALQLGLNLEEYIKDKSQYVKDEEQKNGEKVGQVIITLAEIERRLLEKIQQENASVQAASSIKPNDSLSSNQPETTNNPLPESLPKVKDVKPLNPADAINEELNKMNPNVPISGR